MVTVGDEFTGSKHCCPGASVHGAPHRHPTVTPPSPHCHPSVLHGEQAVVWDGAEPALRWVRSWGRFCL